MTRIDFYILPAPDTQGRLTFACRLIDKALQLGNRVCVAVDGPAEAKLLDQRLWDFKPESFVAHDCEGENSLRSPVFISFGSDCGDHHGLLVNLCRETPTFFSRFERLAEIVCQQEQVLSDTRQHFTFYRERSYPIQTHDLRNRQTG